MLPDFPLTTEAILARKAEYLIPCVYHFYKDPPVLVSGAMQYLRDSRDRTYLDFFSGVSVAACGHCNPRIVEETIEQLGTLQHLSSIYLTWPVVALAERLAGILPGNLSKSFFCCSGSEANEGAFLLARLHTGRPGIVALTRGLHGRTHLGMSATGLPMWRTDPFPDPSAQVVPGPYDEAAGRVTDEACERSLRAMEEAFSSGTIACCIVEPVQGNGGIIPLPARYLQQLRSLCTDHGVLMIDDEVQTGFGRTGRMFGIEHAEVVPDIITMAKALGNGVPVAAFATTPEIAASFTRPSASTLGGNPVSCVTALAVLKYIESEHLPERAAALGARLLAGLNALAQHHSGIADVRGIGLMAGVELRTTDGSPDAARTDAVLEWCKDHGLLLGKNGLHRNVVAFQPPLVITEEDIACCLQVFDGALRATS